MLDLGPLSEYASKVCKTDRWLRLVCNPLEELFCLDCGKVYRDGEAKCNCVDKANPPLTVIV